MILCHFQNHPFRIRFLQRNDPFPWRREIDRLSRFDLQDFDRRQYFDVSISISIWIRFRFLSIFFALLKGIRFCFLGVGVARSAHLGLATSPPTFLAHYRNLPSYYVRQRLVTGFLFYWVDELDPAATALAEFPSGLTEFNRL